MSDYRFTLTTTYTNGDVETVRFRYRNVAYNELRNIEWVNDHCHDVAFVTIYDSKYGESSVFRMEED